MRKQQREVPKFRGVTLVDYDSIRRVAAAASSGHQQHEMQQVSSEKLSFSSFLPSIWEPFRVTCCCDGILCIALWNCLFLWNPYTNDYKRLPFPNPDPQFDPVYPLKEWEAFGIGYDSSIDDYKLVRVPSHGSYGANDSILYVVTLKSNLWRKIDMNFPYVVNEGEQAIPADGHSYWRAESPQTSNKVLIGFDLAKETFSEVTMPPNTDNVQELGVLGGFISLAIYNKCNDYFDIWIMKEQTWIHFVSFPLSSYKGPGSIDRLRPLFFNQDGALVMHA